MRSLGINLASFDHVPGVCCGLSAECLLPGRSRLSGLGLGCASSRGGSQGWLAAQPDGPGLLDLPSVFCVFLRVGLLLRSLSGCDCPRSLSSDLRGRFSTDDPPVQVAAIF